jgi:solute carrier family 25 folate transporter 32
MMDLEKTKTSLAGAGAGLAAAVVTCPLDLVKTRIQNQSRPVQGVHYYRGTFGKFCK